MNPINKSCFLLTFYCLRSFDSAVVYSGSHHISSDHRSGLQRPQGYRLLQWQKGHLFLLGVVPFSVMWLGIAALSHVEPWVRRVLKKHLCRHCVDSTLDLALSGATSRP